MLRECTEQEHKEYADFVYKLALDQSKSGYPTYRDGIKTKEMFLERSQKAFLRDTEKILLFEHEGMVEGWIHYDWLPEDHYLSTVSFNIDTHTEQALQEFLNLMQEQFKGYDLLLGYPKENEKAVHFLSTHGFECIEDDYHNTAFLNAYEPIKASDRIIRIEKANYEYFRHLHTKVEDNMYWNSDRIYADIDNWMIFAEVHDGDPVGCVYYRTAADGWFEIFGIDLKDDTSDSELFRNLLGKALNSAKELGGKTMTFFCDKECQETVSKLGFECVGEYVCFQKHLV